MQMHRQFLRASGNVIIMQMSVATLWIPDLINRSISISVCGFLLIRRTQRSEFVLSSCKKESLETTHVLWDEGGRGTRDEPEGRCVGLEPNRLKNGGYQAPSSVCVHDRVNLNLLVRYVFRFYKHLKRQHEYYLTAAFKRLSIALLPIY